MRGLYYSDWHEVYAGNLALAVAALGHHVTVIVREGAHEFRGQHADAEVFRAKVRDGVADFHVLPGKSSSVSSVIALQRLIASSGKPFDYIHMQPPADPRFMPAMFRFPTVLTLHEPAPRHGVDSLRSLNLIRGRFVERLQRKLASLIVVHTQDGFETLTPSVQRKAVVIPHGVYVPPASSLGQGRTQSKTILFFGTATEYKGLGILFDAMRTVWEQIPEARLRILASPGNVDYRSIDLDSRVRATWEGYSESELDTALAEAQVVCMPYLSASGTGVGSRAYGAGKSIVASDLDGLRELVSSSESLAQPGNAKDLARALISALSRESEIQPVDPKFTWPAVAAEHVKAYRALRRAPGVSDG